MKTPAKVTINSYDYLTRKYDANLAESYTHSRNNYQMSVIKALSQARTDRQLMNFLNDAVRSGILIVITPSILGSVHFRSRCDRLVFEKIQSYSSHVPYWRSFIVCIDGEYYRYKDYRDALRAVEAFIKQTTTISYRQT